MTPTDDGRAVSQHAVGSGLARIYQAASNQIVYQGAEPYRLAAWRPPPPPTVREARAQPSVLLRAANASVDFVDRPGTLARLQNWRDGQADDGVAIHLVHGPGGQGKTRLARHVAELWQRQGWVVLAAHHRRDRSAPEIFEVPRIDQAAGVLVVVDYAERWDASDFLSLLADMRTRAGIQVRVLLLARAASTWWQDLRYRIIRELNLTPTRHELEPLEQEANLTRDALFAAARDRFAELLEIADARHVDPPWALDRHEAYRLVLTVHMAALAAVLASSRGQALPTDPVAVSELLLARERDHWKAMFAVREGRLLASPDAMGQLVYTSIVTGRLGYDDGMTALARARIESSEHPGQLLKDHAKCYPPLGSGDRGRSQRDAALPNGGQATVLEPLYPDRLGEDFLALSTPGHSLEFPTDPWADTALARLLAPTGVPGGPADGLSEHDGAPVWARHGLTTLIEASRRWPHLAHRLYRLLGDHPQLVLHAGGAALAAIPGLESIDPELLEKLASVLPASRHIDLDIGIAAVTAKLADHRLAATTDPAGRAAIHHDLAIRLSNAGLRAQALSPGRQATQLWHDLVEADREAHLPNLAASLDNYASRLAEVGRREEAVPASEQALTFLRELAQVNPDLHLPNLAMALNNHANRLREVGQREEAVRASQEAVDLYSRLVKLNRDAYLPELARALANQAVHLIGIGRREEAVRASQQALTVYRELAQANPDAYLPSLAMSLMNHAGMLAEIGQRDEAVPLSQEAVDLYGELVKLNRDAHLPELAGSLRGHAVRLVQVGRRKEAVPVSEQALTLHRELAQANPDAYLPDLALTLCNHAGVLAEIGQCEAAVPLSQEAVDLYGELVKLNRDAYLPHLAGSLNNHAILLLCIGQRRKAVPLSQEAVCLRRQLVRVSPGAYLPDLAVALNNYASGLAKIGQRDEAVRVSQEAVDLCGELVELNRDAHLPRLAMSLINHASLLAEAGRHDEAVPISERALAFYRELAQANPDAYLPDLVQTLTNRANRLAQVGRLEEAIPVSREAVGLSWGLARANPNAYLADLAGSLTTHAALLGQVRRFEEAIPASGQAVWIRRQLIERNREAFLPSYVQSLVVLGQVLAQCARFGEAVAPLVAAFAAGQQLPQYAQRIIETTVHLLRHCHAEDADVVAANFREVTGQEVPGWMKQAPAAPEVNNDGC